MGADGDGVDAHLDDWVIVAAGLGHVAEVKDIFFFDIEFFEKMGHTKDFVHAWGDGVNRGSAANLVVEFGSEFFAASDDFFAFFAVWVPSVFGFGARFLAEGRESDLAEAIFDDFVAVGELIFLPIAKLLSGGLDGLGDFGNLLVGERVIVDLLPVFFLLIVAVILGALGDKEMEVRKLFGRGIFELVDDLEDELVKFLARDWADFKMVETLCE